MIRKMNTDTQELVELMDLWLESTIKAHPFIPQTYWEDSLPLIRDVYIPKSDTYVYTENGGILGFISLLDKSFIGALFIDVRSQGKGIGKKLIDFAYKTYGSLTLAVYKDNLQALNFYLACGFSTVKIQNNEDTGEVEHIMVKE